MNFMNIWTTATDESNKKQFSHQLKDSTDQKNQENADDGVLSLSSRVNNTLEVDTLRQVPASRASEYNSVHNSESPDKFPCSNSRPCLAGTQTMRHMIRSSSKFDRIHRESIKSSDMSNSSMSSGYHSVCRTDPSNEMNEYDSILETNISAMSAPIGNDSRELTMEEKYFLNNLFEKYACDRICEGSRKLLHRSDKSNLLETPASRQICNAAIKSSIETPRKQALDLKSIENATPIRQNSTSEFSYSTPMIHIHSGKDIQMLEENLASASRYVEELTGGSSNKNSRESSCVRAVDVAIPQELIRPCFQELNQEENYNLRMNHLRSAECLKMPASQQKQPTGLTNDISIVREQSAPRSNQQTAHQFNLMRSLLKKIPSSSSDISVAQTALNDMMKNLNLRESFKSSSQTIKNECSNLESPKDDHHDNRFDPSRLIPSNNNNSNNNQIPDPNFTNQILNLQAALAAISPAALNVLINNLNTQPNMGQIVDIKETLRKVLFNQMENQSRNVETAGNSGILSIINNILTANDQTLTSTTSSLTAFAAALDSSTGLFNQQFSAPATSAQERSTNNTSMASNMNKYRTSNYFPRHQKSNYNSNSSVFYQRPYSLEVPQMVGPYCQFLSNVEGDIDRAATIYRNSANNVIQKTDVTCHWSGKLPVRNYNSMNLSRKVFLGGVPWDSNSEDLIYTFSQFGNLSVLWPQREGYTSNNSAYDAHDRASAPKGYCYLLFEYESCVCELLSQCLHDPVTNGDYFKLSSPKFKTKDVQVIPWVISDSQYMSGNQSRLETSNTIFVGALHGMITAETLANIMTSLFGEVVFAALDTDKHKYPIGSGRVVFANERGYMKAVTANFVEVRTPKFTKTLQIDPFLEDSPCNNCLTSPGIYFCRAFKCFRYFCPACWHQWHNYTESLANHKPLRRSLKPSSTHFIA